MANDEVVLEAARSIRPYLEQLAGLNVAAELDTQLAGLLGEASHGTDGVSDRLLVVLGGPATDAWTAEFLTHGLPPDVMTFQERNVALPGLPEASPAQRFACPVDGNYVWYRMNLGVAVPACPDHQVMLVPA